MLLQEFLLFSVFSPIICFTDGAYLSKIVALCLHSDVCYFISFYFDILLCTDFAVAIYQYALMLKCKLVA